MFTEGAGNIRGGGRQSGDANRDSGRPGRPGGQSGSGRHGGARSGPAGDPDRAEDSRFGGFPGGGSPSGAFQFDEHSGGAFPDETLVDAGFPDGDFREVAPGVLFRPAATAGDRSEPGPVRRPPSGGAWQGSRAAPRASARDAGAPPRPGGRPVQLARHPLRRVLLAGGAALCVMLAALVLLGSGAGASGTTPAVVGSPSAHPSVADGAGDDPTGGAADGASPDGEGAGLVMSGVAGSSREAVPDATGTPAPTGDPRGAGKSNRESDSRSEDTDPDWLEVLSRLDRQRAKAFTKLDEGVLAGAVAPGSAAWTADTAVMSDLRARGLHPKGLRTEVVAVARLGDVAATGPTPAAGPSAAALSRGASVTLLVTDRRAGYDLVDSQGAPVQRIGQAQKAHWQVTLIRGATEIGWLVSDVMARP